MTEPSGASTLASNAFEQQELFPIREVSRLTGVNRSPCVRGNAVTA